MHNNIYNINVAFLCSGNFIKSLEEVKHFLGFNIKKISSSENLNNSYNVLVTDDDNNKKLPIDRIKIPKVFIISPKEKKSPKTIYDLVLKLPINLLEFNQTIIDLSQKYQFDQNSIIPIRNYVLDKNERVLKQNDIKLKVTEKEIHFIEILLNSKKPLNKNFILENVWKYSSSTDTHTVETHIYRLRQKIKNCFGDSNFIKHGEEGYSI
tara:strand:- start:264 stop:890 length:627 start_codon:yes stop_codon:yes gene_type:complete